MSASGWFVNSGQFCKTCRWPSITHKQRRCSFYIKFHGFYRHYNQDITLFDAEANIFYRECLKQEALRRIHYNSINQPFHEIAGLEAVEESNIYDRLTDDEQEMVDQSNLLEYLFSFYFIMRFSGHFVLLFVPPVSNHKQSTNISSIGVPGSLMKIVGRISVNRGVLWLYHYGFCCMILVGNHGGCSSN